jgi:hypothetical protein
MLMMMPLMMETMMRLLMVKMVVVMMVVVMMVVVVMSVLLLEVQDRLLQAAWQDRDATSLLSEVRRVTCDERLGQRFLHFTLSLLQHRRLEVLCSSGYRGVSSCCRRRGLHQRRRSVPQLQLQRLYAPQQQPERAVQETHVSNTARHSHASLTRPSPSAPAPPRPPPAPRSTSRRTRALTPQTPGTPRRTASRPSPQLRELEQRGAGGRR